MNAFFFQSQKIYRFSFRVLRVPFCALLCGLSLAHPALAQGAAPMSPESEWKVSDVRDAKKPTQSYCTLTRAFSQGVVLTIGRNMRAETSLALDFRKDSFAPDKTYTIAMNAGPGARRAFEARPASPSALVISTGKDESLYAGIRKNGKLDVSISGSVYSFNIDGLGEAMDRLSACTDSVEQAMNSSSEKKPEAAKPETKTVAAVSKPVVEPSSAALKKPESSGADIVALREENRRLSETLEKERRAYENKSVSGENGNALIELREKVALLEKENKNLKDRSGKAESTEKEEKISEDLATLRAENVRLRKALADEKSARIDVPEAVSPKAFAALRQKYEDLKAENDRLRDRPDSLASAQTDIPLPTPEDISQTRILEEKLASAQKRVDDLAKEASRLRTEKEKLLLDSSGNDWDAEEATRRYNEADREARRLSVLLDQTKSQCMEEKTKLEAMLFDPAVTSKAQIAHLAKLEEGLQKAKKDMDSAESLCEARIASAEKAAVETGTRTLKEKIEALKTALNDSKTSAESAAQYKEKAESLETALNAAKTAAESESGDKEKNGEKIKALEGALKDAETKLTQAEAKAQSLAKKTEESNKALSDLKADYERKIADLQGVFNREKSDLTAKIASAQSSATQTSEKERAAIGRDILTLRTDLIRKEAEFRQTVARLESEKAALLSQAQALQAQVAENKSRNETTVRIAQEVQTLRAEMAKKDLLWKQQADAAKNESEKKIAILESEKNALQFALSQIGSAAGAASPRVARSVSSPASVGNTVQSRSAPTASAPLSRVSPERITSVPYKDAGAFSSLLRRANLSVSKPVESVPPALETTAYAFRWESGPLFGSAEEREIGTMAQFDDFVSDYLDRTRSRCAGDFASSASNGGSLPAGGRIAAYEIACISSNAGASAALLFAARDGVFTVIAHESGTESIDAAVDGRDRIYNALSSEGTGVVAQR